MDIDDIKSLCEANGMPTDGWATRSSQENPVAIYDRPGYKAIFNRDSGRVRIYDLSVSRVRPVIDSGEDDWIQRAVAEAFA